MGRRAKNGQAPYFFAGRLGEATRLAHEASIGRENAMKKIEAVVKPYVVEDVKKALTEVGVTGMSVVEVKGFGRQKDHAELYRGSEYQVDFLPKVKLEIVIPDRMLDEVIRAVGRSAKTGKIGDGKVFVLPVEEAMRIRTGETGEDSL